MRRIFLRQAMVDDAIAKVALQETGHWHRFFVFLRALTEQHGLVTLIGRCGNWFAMHKIVTVNFTRNLLGEQVKESAIL